MTGRATLTVGYLKTAEEELIEFERREREFLKEDFKERAANLRLSADKKRELKNSLESQSMKV
jgi:hypothetical protein